MWTDPTFIDTVTTGAVAQQVVLILLNPKLPWSITNPFVPIIQSDDTLLAFVGLIMCRDIVARLDAFSPIDFSGRWDVPGTPFQSAKHGAVDCVAKTARFALDTGLAALAGGLPASSPDTNGFGSRDWLWSGMDRDPRCGYGVTADMITRSPTGSYSPASSQASAAVLNAARATRQAASVSIDAGLAATVAATWTAARAGFLARAQAAYPARGYL